MYRMSEDHLPRQITYSQLLVGQRNQGRPRVRFKDAAKRNMKWWNIDTSQLQWQSQARDRPTLEKSHSTINIEQSSSHRRTANDDDDLMIGELQSLLQSLRKAKVACKQFRPISLTSISCEIL